MKKVSCILIVILFIIHQCVYSQANQALSNLTAPTAVNQSLIPGTSAAIDLGSTTLQWQSIFLRNISTTTGPVLIYYGTTTAVGANRFLHISGGTPPGGVNPEGLFLGEFAGQYVTSTNAHNGNVGLGYAALQNLGFTTTTAREGSHNTAVGWRAMINLNGTPTVDADKNTMIGSRAGEWLSSGSQNTGLGYNVFYNGGLTTATITGVGNTAVGGAVDVGDPIVTFGLLGLSGTVDLNPANYNTIVGYGSGIRITSGDNNLIFGDNSGSDATLGITTGSRNILIGQGTNVASAIGNDQLNIGNTLYGNLATNAIGIGNATLPSMFNVGNTNQFQVNTNGRINNYNGIATVNNGVPSQVAVVNVANQSATIPNTSLFTSAAEGFYRVSYMGLITVAGVDGSGTPSSSLALRIKYDDTNYTTDIVMPSANVENMNYISTNSAGGVFSGSMLIYVTAGTTITYNATYACTCDTTAMQYTLRLVLEKL